MSLSPPLYLEYIQRNCNKENGFVAQRILSVSYDSSLLATRAMVLEHGPFVVISVLTCAEALQKCEEGLFDLLILGHSVPRSDKLQMIQRFRKHGVAPVLSLMRPGQSSVAEADFETFSDDPGQLISTVVNILAKCASA